jgi:catechol 2,3-dioxygenase-like lactoylglutathione lyase family enzyme
VLIFAISSIAAGFEDNDLYGISHVGMTVKDLDLSTGYYQQVLGAMLVEGLSTGKQGVYGDSHYYRMFQKEILENQEVPDISDEGTHEVGLFFIP